MGQPWFQLRAAAQRRRWPVVACSSNYTLYGDMSQRFKAVLAQFVAPADHECYSIDESFLDLSRYPLDAAVTGREIREKVLRWTGLPVCVGIGSTKTLAKLANRLAKDEPEWGGICDLTALSAEDRSRAMARLSAREVWGVGHRLAAALMACGVHTADDLRQQDARRIRERFSVVLERTVRELQGTACLGWEDQPPARQQIISSRAFGGPVWTREGLREPVHLHVGRAAQKLRAQGLVAGRVGVWIETNRFRSEDQQHAPFRMVQLPASTDDSAVLNAWASKMLAVIWRPGHRYVKAGIQLDDLRPRSAGQGALFTAQPRDSRREALMATLDAVVAKWGRGAVGVGYAGIRGDRPWSMRREMMSPRYTTRWDEVRSVR